MKIDIPDSLLITITDDRYIKIWSFYTAPKELQNLSSHGGDEDWIAFIPYSIFDKDQYIDFLEEGSPFGRCSVSTHYVNGGEIRIGAHS